MIEQIEKMVNIISPSGYTDEIIDYIWEEAKAMGYDPIRTKKGGITIDVHGYSKKSKTLGLAAHVDTLGAMVRSINSDGTLRFTSIGSFIMASINGEYCTVVTRDGRSYTGTILSKQPSVHVYPDIDQYELKEENMLVRLDASVTNKSDVEALGIEVGNIVGFDPRFRHTESGHIKSRHLDDKASAGVLMGVLKDLKEKKVALPYDMKVIFSVFEEVGHGSSHVPEEVDLLLAIDMGVIGEDLACTEEQVSICVKDSSGPYDRQMVDSLLKTAKEKALDYSLDVYPRYISDASAALRAGADICAALIGPGVHASHHMERTHEKGLINTYELIISWLTGDGAKIMTE